MRALIPILLLPLAGCATVFEGTSQQITIDTHPADAQCVVSRKGEDIARTSKSGEQITVDKSRNPLTVFCKAEGYLPAAVGVTPGASDGGLASISLTGVGTLVDWSTGALHAYPDRVTVILNQDKVAARAE